MTDPILYERLAKLEATVTDLKAQMEVMQHAIGQLEAECRRQKPIERRKASDEKGWPRR